MSSEIKSVSTLSFAAASGVVPIASQLTAITKFSAFGIICGVIGAVIALLLLVPVSVLNEKIIRIRRAEDIDERTLSVLDSLSKQKLYLQIINTTISAFSLLAIVFVICNNAIMGVK